MSSLALVLLSLVGIGPLVLLVNGCDLTLSDPAGTISSPGYDSPYANNLDCEWIFQAQEGMVIEITFEVVDLEEMPPDSDCLDFIQIYDGNTSQDTLISSFCGSGPVWPSHPTRFLSTTSRLTMIMQTDSITSSNTGFTANYKQVPPRTEYIAAVGVDTISLYIIDRFSTTAQVITLPESLRPSAVSFDPVDSYFYYTDVQEKIIGRVQHSDVTQFDIIIRDGIENSEGIAVAYLTRLLYWTDVTREEVSVSRLDGAFRKIIAPRNSGCETPRGIVLTNDQQYVFWSCMKSIERSRADGTSRQKIISGLNNVTALALDPEGQNLYWINIQGVEGFVYYININDELPTREWLHRAEFLTHVHSFVVDSFAFFWSYPGKRIIYHIEHGGSNLNSISVARSQPKLEGLYYFKSDNVIPGNHQCSVNNGGCKEMCFPNGESTTCIDVSPLISGCPSDIEMSTCGPQTVSWEEPTAQSRSNGQILTPLEYEIRTHIPGSTFKWGSVSVQYNFSDQFGITSTCSFDVSLLEIVKMPIEITNCPDDILITTSVPSAINWREPTAASDGAVALESVSHQPGTTFPLGSTEVMYVFTDECGQKARCLFNVTLSELKEMTSTPSTATISEKSAVRASSEKSSQEALTSAQSYTMIIIVAVSVTAMSLICIFLVLVYGFCCRQSQRSMPKLPPATSGVPLSAKVEPNEEFKTKEILDRSRISLDNEPLDKGQYGEVYKGTLRGLKKREKKVVAVKTPKAGASNAVKEDFLDEIKIMIQIGEHPHVMPIYGCCTIGEPFYLVTEYMKYGALNKFLQACGKDIRLMVGNESTDANDDVINMHQVQIAWQISKGMAFISTTRYFHGDLAARNCLVGERLLVKIGDFGLSSDIYTRGYKRIAEDKKRPYKWYSPEANSDGVCSTKGDVWSFGVVMWEIFSFGKDPYPNMSVSAVVNQLKAGYRMPKPQTCPDDIYKIMRECWQDSPDNRPTFPEIESRVEVILSHLAQQAKGTVYVKVTDDDSPTQRNGRKSSVSDSINLQVIVGTSADSAIQCDDTNSSASSFTTDVELASPGEVFKVEPIIEEEE